MAYNSAYTGSQVDAGIAKANSAVQTDGSVPMSGALQMGGNRITNVGAPAAGNDAVRQADLKAVSDEIDHILDGTTPVAIPAATTAKIGGVIVGDGLSVETNGTISADSQLPEGGTNGQILTKTANGETWADPPDTGVTTFNNRSGAVTPQAGDYSADMIEFADGETFQQKYDAGELTGPQGDPGDPGAQGPEGPAGAAATINGVNALSITGGSGINATMQGSTLRIINTRELVFSGITVDTSGWGAHSSTADNDAGFVVRKAIPLSGVTEADYSADVRFAAAEQYSGNYSPGSDTYDGGVYIYAKAAPSASFTIPVIICTHK